MSKTMIRLSFVRRKRRPAAQRPIRSLRKAIFVTTSTHSNRFRPWFWLRPRTRVTSRALFTNTTRSSPQGGPFEAQSCRQQNPKKVDATTPTEKKPSPSIKKRREHAVRMSFQDAVPVTRVAAFPPATQTAPFS